MRILIVIDPGREYAPAHRNPSDNGQYAAFARTSLQEVEDFLHYQITPLLLRKIY
jgi:hypothetical protein